MIKDYNTPSIYGVGYYGIGEFRSRFEGKQTKEYVSWICITSYEALLNYKVEIID